MLVLSRASVSRLSRKSRAKSSFEIANLERGWLTDVESWDVAKPRDALRVCTNNCYTMDKLQRAVTVEKVSS